MKADTADHVQDLAVMNAIQHAGPHFTNGADLAARLGVSRQMIAKRVARLRRQGRAIDGIPTRGYRLRVWRAS